MDESLLIKYFTGKVSPKEREEIQKFISHSEENKRYFSQLKELSAYKHLEYYSNKERVEEALANINHSIDCENNKFKRKRIYLNTIKYAAVFILLVFGTYYTLRNFSKNEIQYVIYQNNEPEEIHYIVLEDGTGVWLNHSAILRYPQKFTKKERRVYLDGEAFFDVQKDTMRPFKVDVSFSLVQVLGTKFSVSTLTESKIIKTILLSGSVEVLDANEKTITKICPGEEVTYNANNKIAQTKNVNAELQTAWRYNQLVFDSISVRDILFAMGQKYNVEFEFQSEAVAQKKLRCVFNSSETLEEVLEIISILTPISYKINDNKVIISEL